MYTVLAVMLPQVCPVITSQVMLPQGHKSCYLKCVLSSCHKSCYLRVTSHATSSVSCHHVTSHATSRSQVMLPKVCPVIMSQVMLPQVCHTQHRDMTSLWSAVLSFCESLYCLRDDKSQLKQNVKKIGFQLALKTSKSLSWSDRLRQTVPYYRTGNREGSVSKLSSCPWNNVV